jgi:hypothetical protein
MLLVGRELERCRSTAIDVQVTEPDDLKNIWQMRAIVEFQTGRIWSSSVKFYKNNCPVIKGGRNVQS